ncbi:hypothetical protein sS8_2691 [Methylocaldum marinum]|uniref:Uncharacterized protein n=1 Tax=Methylocaldum marinum TaxID=1432792 RepID=A0A250KSL6_9GAMM|nr:hypothetical protein sS8_2691 [Methylocaldum marinum]
MDEYVTGFPPFQTGPLSDRPIDKFHVSQRRRIPLTKAAFQNSKVASGAILKTGPQLVKKLHYRFPISNPRKRNPARRDAVFF